MNEIKNYRPVLFDVAQIISCLRIKDLQSYIKQKFVRAVLDLWQDFLITRMHDFG